MKKYLLLTSCLLLLTSIVFSQEVKKIKMTELEDYIRKSDHPLVVNFWATWCAPCVEEIPWIQEGVAKFKEDKVELVLVSLDFVRDYPKTVVNTIKEKKFEGTYFWLDERNADYYCPKVDSSWDGALPVTLLVNNKTGYRRFINRAITDRQVEPELKLLVK